MAKANQKNTVDKVTQNKNTSWIDMVYSEETKGKQVAAKSNQELRCSLCGHPYLRSESKAVPFCSVRCQQIDLGMWLDERLGLPIEGQEDQVFTGYDDQDADQ